MILSIIKLFFLSCTCVYLLLPGWKGCTLATRGRLQDFLEIVFPSPSLDLFQYMLLHLLLGKIERAQATASITFSACLVPVAVQGWLFMGGWFSLALSPLPAISGYCLLRFLLVVVLWKRCFFSWGWRSGVCQKTFLEEILYLVDSRCCSWGEGLAFECSPIQEALKSITCSHIFPLHLMSYLSCDVMPGNLLLGWKGQRFRKCGLLI